jgi:HAD superfamily hydrolase (TIGR01509 family)
LQSLTDLPSSQVKYLLFDCDNTLVLSEEIAFEACADLANQILAKQGITDRYTGDQLIVDFVGQSFRGMIMSLQKKYSFELSEEEIERYVKDEENAVIAKLEDKANPCEGVVDVLRKLHDENKYGMAVVSSSALRRVRASIIKATQNHSFLHDHVFSAATSLEKPTAKPDPAIYLHACRVIGVKPAECVAVEDSKSGATAAFRAGIPCIAYVGGYHSGKKQKEVAEVLTGPGVECKNVMWHWSEFDKCLAEIEAMVSGTQG